MPDAVRTRFREKVRLYREANILLALADRVNPSRDGSDPLFEPVFWEYERIISGNCQESGESHNPDRAARRQSVTVAVQDLNARMHPPSMGNRYEIAREWSRTWFAGIGHKEMNPMTLAMFFSFWASEYTAVQKAWKQRPKRTSVCLI